MEKFMNYVQLMEKRIDSAMTARNRFAEGSWGDEYWANLVAHLMRDLNNYINSKTLH